jgi:hypothetical protein
MKALNWVLARALDAWAGFMIAWAIIEVAGWGA